MDVSAEGPSVHRGERSFASSMWLTVVGAIIPGSGFWFAGRRWLGIAIVAVAVAGVITAVLLGLFNPHLYLHSVLEPRRLVELIVLLAVVALAWSAVIVVSHLLLRPSSSTVAQRAIGVGLAVVLCLVVATPFAVGASYAYTTRDLITHVFSAHPRGKTIPKNVSESDPWAGEPRVNILLLGGDGGVDRLGVRTDSMVVASVNTKTGATVLFSLPRNLENAPFPPGSKLAKLFPNGFNGSGDEGNWLLNAIYRMVPELYPGILGQTDNEGADALKMSVSTILGIKIDYYVLINLQGFEQMVNALGGITVNIDQVIPIGGDLDTGVPPTGWIQPGPDQHLNGFKALWFARGRWNTDDYHRMQRQRCVIDAVINQASPENVFLRYQQIAAAGKKIARTDIPQFLLPALVDLGIKIKNAKVRSVVFQPNAHFNPADPDFDYMRSVVQKALHPTPGQTKAPIIQSPQSACAYHPVASG